MSFEKGEAEEWLEGEGKKSKRNRDYFLPFTRMILDMDFDFVKLRMKITPAEWI